MTYISSFGAHVFMTAYLLFLVGCAAQKVYFDCGAKVDVVDAQGLILSPGFPYNYSSGTHCVWQFFVPVDYQLILEIFDFDVFESHESTAQYSVISNYEGDNGEDELTFTPYGFALGGASAAERDAVAQGEARNIQKSSRDSETEQAVVQERSTKNIQKSSQDSETEQAVVQERSTKNIQKSSQDSETEQAVVQERSTKIAKVSNAAKRSIGGSSGLISPPPASLLLPGAASYEDRAFNTASSPRLKAELDPSSKPSMSMADTTVASLLSTDTLAVSPETQQSVLDACPHDVLYISDLITFSSRFCGSNRPPSSQLVFGSSQEMVEVIMELITTTHWGRGFALLFHYNNVTKPAGERRSFTSASTRADSLLAAVSGAAFFALILTTVVCVVFRPTLCPKRENSCASTDSEVPEGIHNTGEEVSELQPIAENPTIVQGVTREQDHNKYSPPHTVRAAVATSQNIEVDLSSSGLPEFELGPDEVFIISPSPSLTRPSFSPHTRERFLRHSDTGPSSVGDWTPPHSSNLPPGPSGASLSRPRAWSVRTFQDFLPPLPQLHKKWCSWNSTSPFTKLVDSAPPCLVADNNRKSFSDVHLAAKMDISTMSDSPISNASYPLAQAAQRQRRLNSASNLRRSRFTGPCFGLFSGTADASKSSGLSHGQSSQPEPNSSASSIQCPLEGGQAAKRHDFPGEGEHLPVFAISEEEDRQPLVLAEHLTQTPDTAILNGLVRETFEGKRPTSATSSLSPQNQRARPEWRACRSPVSGGVCPLPSNTTMTESNTISSCQLPLSQPAVLCINHM
ncbi:uncharacterized protein si:dkey-112e17.1 isoform X2 [Entelurus aequoreus]|uniref:uncharacterized protein si:dkey-112e17.1 isoform X2 n=1 Tax=Entelurus aequoreus TaxID=161455 RepID=UPI002B1E37BD|nr:uncharacterized protein si:dkey-112e17.1 isoform X2 [Entelurus aequoreus]